MDASVNLPPLPDGFSIVQANALPPLPAGFSIQQQPSIGMDVAKSVGSNLVQGAASLPMAVPNLVNGLFTGPQLLGRGIASGVDKVFGIPEQPRGDLWKPFFDSGDVTQAAGLDYQPKTVAGAAVAIPAQIGGAMLAGGAASRMINNPPSIATDESSGSQIPVKAQTKTASQPEENILQTAGKNTLLKGKPNALQAGYEANQKISAQYGSDKELQANLYNDVNQKGSVLSIKAPDLYSRLDDLTNYLNGKVAVDTPEYRALTELKEYQDSLQSKYGIAGTSDKAMQLPSWKQPMVVQKGSKGQEAYGIQPSDLVDLKTTINSGLKPNKFSDAGSAKILAFKKYVQGALDDASSISPEFGQALTKAETQAAKVGQYRSPALRALWQPEDYVSYKAGNAPSAATLGRARGFLNNLNTSGSGATAGGRPFSLATILPKEDAQAIFRAAILNSKPSGIKGAILPAPPSPLSELADQISKMKAKY